MGDSRLRLSGMTAFRDFGNDGFLINAVTLRSSCSGSQLLCRFYKLEIPD